MRGMEYVYARHNVAYSSISITNWLRSPTCLRNATGLQFVSLFECVSLPVLLPELTHSLCGHGREYVGNKSNVRLLIQHAMVD